MNHRTNDRRFAKNFLVSQFVGKTRLWRENPEWLVELSSTQPQPSWPAHSHDRLPTLLYTFFFKSLFHIQKNSLTFSKEMYTTHTHMHTHTASLGDLAICLSKCKARTCSFLLGATIIEGRILATAANKWFGRRWSALSLDPNIMIEMMKLNQNQKTEKWL